MKPPDDVLVAAPAKRETFSIGRGFIPILQPVFGHASESAT